MVNFFQDPSGSVVVYDKIPIRIACKAAAATVFPRASVETVQTGNADSDRKDITISTALSKTHLGWVDYDLANKRTLGQANQNPTKASTFADNDEVWVTLRAPIVEAVLTSSQATVLPGQRLCCGGLGTLIKHPDSLVTAVTTAAATYYLAAAALGTPVDPTVAIALGRYITGSTTQVIQVMPLW